MDTLFGHADPFSFKLIRRRSIEIGISAVTMAKLYLSKFPADVVYDLNKSEGLRNIQHLKQNKPF
jgi:hypothetical protein